MPQYSLHYNLHCKIKKKTSDKTEPTSENQETNKTHSIICPELSKKNISNDLDNQNPTHN